MLLQNSTMKDGVRLWVQGVAMWEDIQVSVMQLRNTARRNIENTTTTIDDSYSMTYDHIKYFLD